MNKCKCIGPKLAPNLDSKKMGWIYITIMADTDKTINILLSKHYKISTIDPYTENKWLRNNFQSKNAIKFHNYKEITNNLTHCINCEYFFVKCTVIMFFIYSLTLTSLK